MQSFDPRVSSHLPQTPKFHGRFPASSSQNSYMETPSLSHDGFDTDMPSPTSSSHSPPSRILMEEYSKPLLHLDTTNPQPRIFRRSSTLYDDDPMTTHLLVETAIGDSQSYKVLSFEELHEIKREQDLASRRIQALRRNLHLETKVRNAAQSLSRLQNRSRRNGTQASATDDASIVEGEAAASNRKCEELAQEIWKLEKRQAQLHDKQLQHTAGILHMEHHFRQQEPQQARPPSSPSFELQRLDNDRDGIEQPRKSIEQLQESVKESQENQELPREFQEQSPEPQEQDHKSAAEHSEIIQAAEVKLQQLQERLRELVQLASSSSTTPSTPDTAKVTLPLPPNASMTDSLENLEVGLGLLEEKIISQRLKTTTDAIEARIQGLNNQVQDHLNNSRLQRSFPSPPQPGEGGNVTQYLETGLHTMNNLLHESYSRESSLQDQSQQTNAYLTGLWEIVTASEEDARQRKMQDDGQATDSSPSPIEPFTIQAFSAKIQKICGHLGDFADQHNVLRQQINQQREAHASAEQVTVQQATNQEALKVAEDRNIVLEKELKELIAEYEGMIKLNVEGEREREALEITGDQLREKVEELELRINDQKVKQMGRPQTASGHDAKEATSMAVMRTEFKKMMRDARAEHFKHLKAEKEERRKLEALVRTLRKEQSTSQPLVNAGTSVSSMLSPASAKTGVANNGAASNA